MHFSILALKNKLNLDVCNCVCRCTCMFVLRLEEMCWLVGEEFHNVHMDTFVLWLALLTRQTTTSFLIRHDSQI